MCRRRRGSAQPLGRRGYPREGHGRRESTHIVDSIDRSIEWYEKPTLSH
jgi:hypothetical protein